MTGVRAARIAAALALLVALAACAQRSGPGASPEPSASADPTAVLPADAGGLVLQVAATGGFVTPSMLAARLPIISVYADGRVITEGPVPAIYPGPAWPNVQVQQVDRAAVQAMADRALAAGVAGTADLGTPPIADATSTRFTLVTADGRYIREVYALGEAAGLPGPGAPEPGSPSWDSGLTAEQEAARGALAGLLDELTGVPGDGETVPYEPAAVAAVVSPWIDLDPDLRQPELPWPGPALPGESTSGPPDVSCVIATGAQAQAVRDAARSATSLTPWVTPDGTRWSVTFRPLLPHESSCADLTG